MANAVRLVVALGNPGAGHAGQRHNAGFWFADRLADEWHLSFRHDRKSRADVARFDTRDQTVRVVKPDTYMNLSGESVASIRQFHKIEPAQILVVHDELDLAPGVARFKSGGGHGGHNGLRDITRVIGADFRRLRIGIGHPGSAGQVLGHVLGKPDAHDREAIGAAIDRAIDAVDTLVSSGWERAASQLNTKTDSGA